MLDRDHAAGEVAHSGRQPDRRVAARAAELEHPAVVHRGHQGEEELAGRARHLTRALRRGEAALPLGGVLGLQPGEHLQDPIVEHAPTIGSPRDEVEHTLEIGRPLDEVFEYLTDVSRLPEWQSSAESAELEGELREGARITEVRTFMGRRATSILEVSEYLPPSRFSLHVVEGPIRYSVEHALEALDGRTRVTFVGRGETKGVPRLMHGAVRRAVERQFVKDLELFKRNLESGDAQRTSTLT